ncbi:MAG: EscU/YscU/HrcU family type III secretion system export apparatus switch protein [Acidobacteriota bacterium]
MSSDRTEQPTARRLREAKRKGQVARSRDLGQAAALVGTALVLGWMGPSMARILTEEIQLAFAQMGDQALATLTAGDLTRLAAKAGRAVALVCGPVALASVAMVVGSQAAQGGWIFSTDALRPDWARLSPARGIKRLGLSQGGVDLLKTILVVTTLAVLGWQDVRDAIVTSLALGRAEAVSAAADGWDAVLQFVRRSAVVLLAFALADYAVQRWRFIRSQRMTKQEVRDDYRLTEGSPETKMRVRRIQRDMIRSRMLSAVPRATVVVTNPTHYAVALEYRRGSEPAPRVVAKGRDLIAQRIKTVAREHGVPIAENPPLARALYGAVPVGGVIPGTLFEAVAEVLAYLIRLRQLAL